MNKNRRYTDRAQRSDQVRPMSFDDKVRAKKNLGQHFLTDLSIAQRIADTLDTHSQLPVLALSQFARQAHHRSRLPQVAARWPRGFQWPAFCTHRQLPLQHLFADLLPRR